MADMDPDTVTSLYPQARDLRGSRTTFHVARLLWSLEPLYDLQVSNVAFTFVGEEFTLIEPE